MNKSSGMAVAVVVIACCTPMSKAEAPIVLHASADDCEIVAAIGKEKLNWGAKPPTAVFYSVHEGPRGSQYIQDCDWKKLGVAVPLTDPSASQGGFHVSRPEYRGDLAKTYYSFTIAPTPFQTRAFASYEKCALEKRAGHWRLLRCECSPSPAPGFSSPAPLPLPCARMRPGDADQ
jgi:hypothetical protein